MRTRWTVLLAVLVIVTLMIMSVRAGHAEMPTSWTAAGTHAPVATRVEAPVYTEDGARTVGLGLGLGGSREDASSVPGGAASGSRSTPDESLARPVGRVKDAAASTSLSVLENTGVARAPRQLEDSTSALSAAIDAGAAQDAANSALASGSATSGPLQRATVVKTATGTANIYNSAVAVGFMFDPSDNPQHRLQFTGPQVALAEFSLHGSAASAVTIDGQPAVAGQWYPLHAGLTIVAPQPVGIHVRPAPPHSNG